MKKPIGDNSFGISISKAPSLLLRRHYKCHSPLVGCKLVDIESCLSLLVSLRSISFGELCHLTSYPHLVSSHYIRLRNVLFSFHRPSGPHQEAHIHPAGAAPSLPTFSHPPCSSMPRCAIRPSGSESQRRCVSDFHACAQAQD